MSKASERAKRIKAAQAETLELRRERVTACVDEYGNCHLSMRTPTIAGDTTVSGLIYPKDALAFGKWLIDTFGEEVQSGQ